MALLYPWATKEYLLWEMSIGQIILYLNIGMDMKYPDPKKKNTVPGASLVDKSEDELRAMRDEYKKKYGDI